MSEFNDGSVLAGYDMRTRELVSLVQAFIAHHKDPGFFLLPDLDEAKETWQRANDFNVIVYERRREIDLEKDKPGLTDEQVAEIKERYTRLLGSDEDGI